MRSIARVFKFEFLTTITRRSFILTVILVPLIPALLLGLLNLLQGEDNPSLVEIFAEETSSVLPFGVVDRSGLIREYPDWLTGGNLLALDDEAAARELTAEGSLQGFYVIAADYLETGAVKFVKPEISMITEVVQSPQLEALLDYNLLNADPELYARYTNPAQFSYEYLDPDSADTRDQSNFLAFTAPYVVTLFFYMIILISASLMMNVISKDKENRTMEILLSSVKPLDLYLGKLLALGTASLLQMVIWYGTIALILGVGGATLNIPGMSSIPLEAILLAIPFFLLGFALYGSLMAGVGAIAPNLREGSQSSFVITLPLIFSIISISRLILEPHSGFTVLMSLFPLTSPVVMMTRLSVGNVPGWQVGVSIAILALTVVIIVRGVANLFSSQTLLSGEKLKIGKFLRTVFVGR